MRTPQPGERWVKKSKRDDHIAKIIEVKPSTVEPTVTIVHAFVGTKKIAVALSLFHQYYRAPEEGR